MGRRQVLDRRFDPVLAQIIEIRGQLDRNGFVGACRDIVNMQVRPHLIHHAAVRKRCILGVPPLILRVLLEILTVLVHRPKIHGAVAV